MSYDARVKRHPGEARAVKAARELKRLDPEAYELWRRIAMALVERARLRRADREGRRTEIRRARRRAPQ